MSFESQNEVERAMANAGGGAGGGDETSGDGRPTPAEMAAPGVRILERLIAGSTLAGGCGERGASRASARAELVAEVVAQRGFDP